MFEILNSPKFELELSHNAANCRVTWATDELRKLLFKL